MKKRIFIAAAAVLALALVAGGVLAFISVSQPADQVVTTGSVRLAVHETAAEDTVILPGETVSNVVTVENTGANPAYVRVAWQTVLDDGTVLPAESILVEVNSQDWTYQDGYYYYNKALAAGESTAALFEEMTFNGKVLDNSCLGKALTLEVTAYGVQSQHNGDDPLAAAGWPEA